MADAKKKLAVKHEMWVIEGSEDGALLNDDSERTEGEVRPFERAAPTEDAGAAPAAASTGATSAGTAPRHMQGCRITPRTTHA